MFHFLVTNLEKFGSFNKFIFFIFHYLCYSVTSNESKEKFRMIFCCFLAMKNVAPSFSSNFPVKLICRGILALVCLDKSVSRSL